MRTSLDLTAVTTCRDGLILEVQVLGWRVRVPWPHVAGVWTEEEDAAGCVLAIEAFSRPVPLAMDDAPQQYAMWCDMAGAAVVMRAWHDWGPESLGGAVQRVEAVAECRCAGGEHD